MKLLKSISTRASNFGAKMLHDFEKSPKKDDAKPRDSSTDLSSFKDSRKSLKDKVPIPESIPEPPNADLELLSPSRKKKKKKAKRVSNVTEMVDDSIRSEVSNTERTRQSINETPRNNKTGGAKKKKKKKKPGDTSRRSEASEIRQSIMLEHSEVESDREEVEGEAWLGNFGPNQAISHTLGPQAMPNLDEKDEQDTLEEQSIQLGIPLPPNDDLDTMNDSKVSLADSYVMENPPPIGELVVGRRGDNDDDDVSDIGEPAVEKAMESATRTSTRTTLAPEDEDICFQDRGHPGTRVMTKVIRNLLEENENAKYTISMGKLLKRKLKGRKYWVLERKNEEVFWREAEKKEMNKMMAEFFKEERRRKEEGLEDDDSEEQSSLEDSARQSSLDKSEENSISIEDLGGSHPPPPPPPPPPPEDDDDQVGKPTTPKMNNSNHKKRISTNSPNADALKQIILNSGVSSGGETTSELLSQITEQRKNAEDYALPFNSYEMMENGRKAEEKLRGMMEKAKNLKAKTHENDEIRLEIHKMDLLLERVMYASIGPLLEMLERMDETMNELVAEENEEDQDTDILSPPTGNPKLQNVNNRRSGAMRKSRTVGGDNDDSQNSLTNSPSSPSRTNRTIRSGSKRSRESRNQSSHDPASKNSEKSLVSGSQRKLDKTAHPHGSTFLNESRLEASGVSVYDDEISDVPQDEIRIPQLSSENLNYVVQLDDDDDDDDGDYDEDMQDETEVEIPLNDEGDYESIAESSGYSGSHDRSSRDGQSNGEGDNYGFEEVEEQLKGPTQYTVPLKGGSSHGSYSSDGRTPSRYSGSNSASFRRSFASIEENQSERSHSEGSQSLRMEQVFEGEVFERSQSARSMGTKTGKVIMASEHGRKSDDMSSIGESQRRMYGEDTSEDEEFQDEDISDVDDDERLMSVDSDDSHDDLASETKPLSVKTPTAGATKIEQFFDRLQHFFEVRRKVEERTDIIDPSGKCRRMKIKCAAKLLPKSNGEFGTAHQQRNLDNEVVNSLDQLYKTAELARPALNKVLDHLTDDVMGLDMQSIQLAELKPRDRAFEKAKEEFGDRRPGPPESWLCDIVRASVICKSYKQMNDVNKWLQKNCEVVKAKNRFLEPCFNGYRDLLFHISVPYDGTLNHICEIQVHHRDMNALEKQFGMPKHYEFFRSYFAGPWRDQEDTLMDLALMNKHGDMGSMMVKLLRSKDPDQLRLYASLCREKLDEFDKALEFYRRILVLQGKDAGMDHETMADTHRNIGLVYGSKGDIDESLYHLQKALTVQEEEGGTDNAKGAALLTEIGRMLSKKGDFEGALANFEQALEIRENAFGNEHFMVISSLQDIGQAFGDMGDYAASEVSYRKALKLQEKMLNDVHPDIATTSRLIGTTLCKYGDFGTAMELHRLALSIRETSLGKNHPMTAESQTDIGIVLCQKGDLENAEWRHRKALRIRELKGKEDEDCAISLSYLGDVLSRKGEYAEAIKLIKRAQQIRENELGLDHPVTAATHIDLGNVYYKQGDAESALKEYRRAMVARESMFGPDHQETAVALSCLGNALNLKGDYEAAHNAHIQALDIYAHFLGEGHPLTATGYQNIADTLLLMGDKEKALIQHRKALAIRANVLSKDHPDTALSCSRIGDLLAEKDDLVGALVAHKQALAITVGLSGEDTVASAKAHIHVGLVLAAQGEFDDAIEEFEQAMGVLEKILGENHKETARAFSLIGSVHSARDDFDEAFKMHSRAHKVFETIFGEDHQKTLAAANKCKMAKAQQVETEF